MDLKEQRYVCALSETGSLAVAARQLGISSSALSLYISNLEASMGVKLFERVGKQFVTTYIGELYIKAAKEMLKIKSDFDFALSDVVENYRGRIHLGMQRFRSPYLSPQLIYSFTQMHPTVSVVLTEALTSEGVTALLDNKMDLYFGNYLDQRHSGLNYQTIAKDMMVLVTSRAHPIQRVAQPTTWGPYPWVNIQHLKNERILLQNRQTTTNTLTYRLFEENHFKPDPQNVVPVGSVATTLQMVGYGYGVFFCPASFARIVPLKRPTAIYSVGNSPLMVEFGAMTKKGRELPQYADEMVDLVRGLTRDVMNPVHAG